MREDDPTTTLDRWLAESTDSIVSLVEACDSRCMAIDTTKKSKEMHDAKVRELMSMVDRMVEQNGGRVYTNEMLERAEQAYREREEEMLRAQHEEEKRRQQEIDQAQDALLATRLQAEEREKHFREQHDALVATHREQERHNRQAVSEARDRNRETVKEQTGGIWESLCKHTLPAVVESFSRMYVGSGEVSPNGQAEGSSTSNNHQPGGFFRQAIGRQEETNPTNSSVQRHADNTGLRGAGASSSFYRHQQMVNFPSGGPADHSFHQPVGFSMTRGNGFGARSGAGHTGGFGRGGFGGNGRPAHHHHH
ncbi:unnamed protein product [Rotaria sp. Silwood2]|nr:unnamed protein product [Rotaria sp. Silwood2]CAF3126272.1 unnamed protein product [Rotaria sp. Silwood2]CAF3961223.1 unnamed protein product [Rotaria sp. Silwood2]CAF4219074.1 unnamed protein product [Rotaria sp. Silwood2]